tara:strand:+ start:33 stop:398 length:366 start_codon:yes stop_codon:yes gene_type:complete
MPDFIAAAEPIVVVLVGLGALLWFYNEARKAMGKGGVPQPLSISMKDEFVPFTRYEKDHSVLDTRLTKATASRKEMHDRLGQLENRTARLEEQNASQTKQLDRLDRKLDIVLDRLPPNPHR